MKTTEATTKRSLPNPFRFTAYMVGVAALCFLNWTVLKAGDPVEYHSAAFNAQLAETIAEEAEPEMIVENWMLGFDEVSLADNEEFQIEDWMFGYDKVTLAAREEVKVEEWMLGYDDVTLAYNTEILTESWMYNYRIFAQTGVNDSNFQLEEWMVDLKSWGTLILLARK